MEERKRNHLTLEIKKYIVLEKIRKPRRTVRDLVHDVNLKYGIKPSIGAIHNVLKSKENILENMKDATKFGLNRKRLISKERPDFESLLDSKLIEINPEVVKEQKKQKQSQITDFFRSHK